MNGEDISAHVVKAQVSMKLISSRTLGMLSCRHLQATEALLFDYGSASESFTIVYGKTPDLVTPIEE
jgi:hypothetical protein